MRREWKDESQTQTQIQQLTGKARNKNNGASWTAAFDKSTTRIGGTEVSLKDFERNQESGISDTVLSTMRYSTGKRHVLTTVSYGPYAPMGP